MPGLSAGILCSAAGQRSLHINPLPARTDLSANMTASKAYPALDVVHFCRASFLALHRAPRSALNQHRQRCGLQCLRRRTQFKRCEAELFYMCLNFKNE
ncbi:hypothetical protein NDU88_007710 [Pleurodeles waltl]|uniref:Uncharacterized protein n=1 Tax=Pleurodeles waltl TaxID=8319 RepID=A0AAV7N7P0_PLEWA|nr:hypothetical protein NDU88_007710 [Pleurodeles waltl]